MQKNKPALNIGDTIVVCDCDETPIIKVQRDYYEVLKNKCVGGLVYNELNRLYKEFYNKVAKWRLIQITSLNTNCPMYYFEIVDDGKFGLSYCRSDLYYYPSVPHFVLLKLLEKYNKEIYASLSDKCKYSQIIKGTQTLIRVPYILNFTDN